MSCLHGFKVCGFGDDCPDPQCDLPDCRNCGKSDKVANTGPEMIGSGFYCSRCKRGWTQET